MGAVFTQSRTPSEFRSNDCEAKGGVRRKSRTSREEQLHVRHHQVQNFLKYEEHSDNSTAPVAAIAAIVAAKASAAQSAAVPKADLFSALNKGDAITSGSSPTLSFHTIQHLHTLHYIHTLLLVLQASRLSRRTCRLGGRSTKAAMPRPPP